MCSSPYVNKIQRFVPLNCVNGNYWLEVRLICLEPCIHGEHQETVWLNQSAILKTALFTLLVVALIILKFVYILTISRSKY